MKKYLRIIIIFVAMTVLLIIAGSVFNMELILVKYQTIYSHDLSNRSKYDTNFENVVFTVFCTTQKDPQRYRRMPSSFEYMNNFYVSVNWLDINVIIFYDNLTQQFIKNHETNRIKFKKIKIINSLSINDFRFIIYNEWLENKQYKKVLFVDIADVFFWTNPFNYMDRHNFHGVFFGLDKGTLMSNNWIRIKFRKCYGNAYTDLNHTAYNAGVWGGELNFVLCILKCASNQLKRFTKKRLNCNMAVLNWCILHSHCINKTNLYYDPFFLNRFRGDCEKKHVVIHDKCPTSKTKCLTIFNNTLTRHYCSSKHGYYNK